eukprot:7178251-Prymnesium_polylepis.1
MARALPSFELRRASTPWLHRDTGHDPALSPASAHDISGAQYPNPNPAWANTMLRPARRECARRA